MIKLVLFKIPPVWIVFLAYQLITILFVAIFDSRYFITTNFLVPRIAILVYFVIRRFNKRDFFFRFGDFFDVMIIYVSLSYFYGETARFNTYFFEKLDPFLYKCDEWLFGFQPSIVFSERFGSAIFSELMYLGYFSYYLMPFVSFIIIWKLNKSFFNEFSFLVLSSYFIYYLLFILFPAEGPQFYLQPPLNSISANGPFATLVKLIQSFGEAPTAAFPSSHIGISTILLTLLYKKNIRLFRFFLPFCIMLLLATVYIKAHYFIDVFAGILSAPVVLTFTKFIYTHFSFQLKK